MTAAKESFYLTTPIYYVNAAPHLGTAYTTIAADAMARYRRQCGYDVLFLTGLDEHGQKVQAAANAAGRDPQDWVDALAVDFREVWRQLNISYDRFIRTTDADHTAVVRALAQKLYDSGDIYKGSYHGWYCLPDETYWAPNDLEGTPQGAADGTEGADGADSADSATGDRVPLCPDCHRPLTWVEEENYFFRLSAYQDWLLDYCEAHPDFIGPETRRNEVLSFVRGGLKDLSISRANVDWGIPLPWDESHTMYVWFDALINYITAAGYAQPGREEEFAHRWPAQIHYVGKDIIRFHCVIWPALLHAAGLPIPERVFAHGFLLTRGEKMSKSKGNATRPLDLVERFGVDGYRYYFLRDVSFGQDGNISDEAMVQRYNGDLANDWGNLVSRLFNMVGKYRDGRVPDYGGDMTADAAEGAVLRDVACGLYDRVRACYDRLDYAGALTEVWELVKAANRYLEESAPWTLAKIASGGTDGGEQDARAAALRLSQVLYSALEAVRIVALYTAAVMPATADEVCARLGLAPASAIDNLAELSAWGLLPAGNEVRVGDPLFPRLEK
ncbi:MAG: methionine--tRNA ligase [Actinomycetes bacterium]|jgi:methionyl-tRNA synthetase|nr:methionine--tRNA ligase [Actinomycetes bacterium]